MCWDSADANAVVNGSFLYDGFRSMRGSNAYWQVSGVGAARLYLACGTL